MREGACESFVLRISVKMAVIRVKMAVISVKMAVISVSGNQLPYLHMEVIEDDPEIRTVLLLEIERRP